MVYYIFRVYKIGDLLEHVGKSFSYWLPWKKYFLLFLKLNWIICYRLSKNVVMADGRSPRDWCHRNSQEWGYSMYIFSLR